MSRVAIVEDHRLLAEVLTSALESSGVSARLVPSPSLYDVLVDLRAAPADLVLLDLDLGDCGDSTPLVGALTAEGMRVLVVTGTPDPLRIAAALEQGAVGYQQKAPGFEPLLARVQAALATDRPLDPAHRVELLEELRRVRRDRETGLRPFDRLTRREAETLRALARGATVSELARDWFLSEATMRSHVRSILAKLGVSSQLAAVAAALRTGWLDDRTDDHADDRADDFAPPASDTPMARLG